HHECTVGLEDAQRPRRRRWIGGHPDFSNKGGLRLTWGLGVLTNGRTPATDREHTCTENGVDKCPARRRTPGAIWWSSVQRSTGIAWAGPAGKSSLKPP